MFIWDAKKIFELPQGGHKEVLEAEFHFEQDEMEET